jgi:hypothetical protein
MICAGTVENFFYFAVCVDAVGLFGAAMPIEKLKGRSLAGVMRSFAIMCATFVRHGACAISTVISWSPKPQCQHHCQARFGAVG